MHFVTFALKLSLQKDQKQENTGYIYIVSLTI